MEFHQPGYNATEAATILLNAYRERRESFHALNDYDKAMAHMRHSVGAKIATLGEPLKGIAAKLFDVTDKGFFLFQVCEWKLDYLAAALIHAIDAKNPLALANNTRGLVEHLAALVAVIKELERLEHALRGQGQAKSIGDALARTERFIWRGYYGKSPKTTNDKNQQALHVNDCLLALKDDVPDIEDVYDFLCEYVHPNYGSNLLVSTGELATGRLNPPEDFHRETLDRLRRYCSLSMLLLERRGISGAAVFVRLQALLDRCFTQGATVNNVFSFKAPKPEGDGLSQETAYWFPKARTPMEAIDLCYEFLANAGHEIHKRENHGLTGEFVIDAYTTDKGTVWFKVPMMEV